MTVMHVRYLGILIDDKLNWNNHTNNIVSKLMRGNSVLSKLKYYVNKEILRTNYFIYSIPIFLMSPQYGDNQEFPKSI